jgi:hypothetical protein
MSWKTSTEVTKGSTDVSIYMVIPAGLTITDIDLQFTRSGISPVPKQDLTALAAADSAHADNKGVYVDFIYSPGLFRVDVPDAAFESNANCHEVMIVLSHTSGTWIQFVKLVNYDSGSVDAIKISGDSTAADALETMLDGTGGNKLTLSQLKIVATGNDSAIEATGSGSGSGQKNTGGGTGYGTYNIGGETSGDGLFNYSALGNGSTNVGGTHGITATGTVGSDISAANSYIGVNVTSISGDTGAADALETMLDGTGGNKLTLSQLKIVATGSDSAIDVLGAGTGHGIKAQGGTDSTIGGDGFNAQGGDSFTQGGSGIGAVAGA